MAITENFFSDLYALTQQRCGIGSFAWIIFFEMGDLSDLIKPFGQCEKTKKDNAVDPVTVRSLFI